MIIPPGWQTIQLAKLVDVLDSKRIPLSAAERKHREGNVPYYGATGQVGTIDKSLFDEPLILLGEDGVQFFDATKPKAYPIDGPSWVNNHAHVLRPKAELIEFGYLLHYLNAFDYHGYANGTTRLKLTQGAMNSMPVHLPSLLEQKRIVEILDDHLSRLDIALAEIDASTLRAESFRRSLLEKELFGDFSGSTTMLGDHIQTRKTKGIPSQEPGAKYLGLEHVEAHGGRILGFDSASNYRSASLIVEEGDLLYGRLRPYLNKVVISPERLYVSGEFIVMLGSETLDTTFLKYLLMSPRFLAFTALLDTGDRPRVSWDKIAHFEFRLPDLEVQKRIVGEIESLLAVTGAMQNDFENLKRHSQTLRRSLLNAAFSGKLRNG